MLAPTPVVAPDPMVGRHSELEELDAALAALAAGSSACLAIEGEPGIGKTRLLAELRVRAEERGQVVLSGSAAEFERDLPYGVWVEALDSYVAARELAQLADGNPGIMADLARVLPSVRDGDGPHAAAVGDERHRAHRAVRQLLATVAEEGPLVVVLDDLHWSDAASIELIGALVRKGLAPGLLLALGYRTGQAPPGLDATLVAPEVTVLELGELGEADCRRLAGADLSGRRHAEIFSQSGGNPFYALQLARASRQPSRSSSGDRLAEEAGVPRTVAAALVSELDALTPRARLLLDAGSVAGDPFEPELAWEIAGLMPDAGTAALDELLHARLLHTTAVPRRFAFRHPLVRRAVYQSTGGGWRLAAHARAASRLASLGASAAVRAHHIEQSASHGDEASIALLLEAGATTAPVAPATAARWYAAALRLLPETDVGTRRQTLTDLAQALRSTGDLSRCVGTLLAALDLVPADEVRVRVTLTAACAAAENFLGRHDQARRRLASALDAVPEPNSREAVTTLLALVATAFFTMDVQDEQEFAARGLAAGRALADPVLIGATASALAQSAANVGATQETRASLDEAAAHLDEVVDDALWPHLDAVNRLAWTEFLVERYDDAIRHAARGVAVARATGQEQFGPLIMGSQAVSLARRGELAAAQALQAEALDTAELAANAYVMCWVLTVSAHVATERGELESAHRLAARAVAVIDGMEDSRVAAMARVRLAVTRRLVGDASASRDTSLAADGSGELAGIQPSWRVYYATAMTHAELATGNIGDADAFAVIAERTAQELTLPVATAMADRARAAVQLARSDVQTAANLALTSADAAATARAPIEAARSQALAGRALAAYGERTRAVQLLRSAENAFDACGAERDRKEVRHQLRRLGARSEPRGPASGAESGVASLTRREREIAEFVLARKTNREIAAELFLSAKTVETHLRNIFVKLSVSSRVEVARAMAAADGVATDRADH